MLGLSAKNGLASHRTVTYVTSVAKVLNYALQGSFDAGRTRPNLRSSLSAYTAGPEETEIWLFRYPLLLT
jgi:hypothetical protein